MRLILGLMGALSCLYGVGCLWTNRFNIGIAAFLAVGILLLCAAKYFSSLHQFFKLRKGLRAIFFMVLAMGVGGAAYLEASILWGMKEQHPQSIDHIIVLGAGVKNGTPTPVLQTRLLKAIEVHQKYPKAKIYVTGGLDTGEKKTEAEVMREFLVGQGVSSHLIVLEDKATSTQENFIFTKPLIPDPQPKVIVVTSDYHLYRAKFYAKKAGFVPYSAGARIPLSIVPLAHMREVLAVGFMVVKYGW